MKKLVILLVLLLSFSLYGCDRSGGTASAEQETAVQSECETAIINTYFERIHDASIDFYDEYFTIEPRTDYYTITVKEITSEGQKDGTNNPTSLITFVCEPFVGPHDSIGRDEITFSADYTGVIELKEFKHIKSYTLPDNLKGLVKKKIPGEYE